MTKLKDMGEAESKSRLRYISEVRASYDNARSESLNRINNYLFVLNSGGLLAALTYIASTKPISCYSITSIVIFSIGILCSVLHATLDYYLNEQGMEKFENNAFRFQNNELEWLVFYEELRKEFLRLNTFVQSLGWIGGFAFMIGLVVGVVGIIKLA